ncbi:phage/plasmid replication protein, II/X family [Paraburkholderia sp. XV]|uniref:phage/plasmid replication protein, II/X family n=1 Tax=Paraburkholderia sp. XV TaxID=2831520 RepID=UPI001CD659F7|nr:phage/plasmid replication protein, II/X family [Paraburkholderia sp. XV]
MIDLIDIKILLAHKPFGNERVKLIENSSSSVSKRYGTKIRLREGAAPLNVISLNNGTAIAMRCCPLKPLQGHNVFGTNDICLLGSTIICAVLDQLRVPYTEKLRAAWNSGEFELQSLDITNRFALPHQIDARQLSKYMLRNTSFSLLPAALRKGTGVRMEVPRSHAAWLFYDKRQELDDKRTSSQPHLWAVLGKQDINVWNLLRNEAVGNIRAELKLSKEYLAQHKLDRGFAWTDDLVQQVFFAEMSKLRFERHQPIEYVKQSATHLPAHLRRTFELWARGAGLGALFSPSGLAHHRSEIRRETRVDIMRDVPVKEVLPLSDIFSSHNMLPAFPDWHIDYPLVAFGSECGDRCIALPTNRYPNRSAHRQYGP